MSDGGKPEFDLQGMLGGLLGRAQEMKDRMEQAQARAATKRVEGQAGGGVVRVVVTGQMEVKEVRILPLAFESGDVTMLEDLVTAAVNDALRRAKDVVEGEASRVTGDLDPGNLAAMLGGLMGGAGGDPAGEDGE